MLKQKTLSVHSTLSKMDDGQDESSFLSKRLESDNLFSFVPSNAASSRKRHQSGNSSAVGIYLEEPFVDIDGNPLIS